MDDADSELPTPAYTSHARTDGCQDVNNGDRGEGGELNGDGGDRGNGGDGGGGGGGGDGDDGDDGRGGGDDDNTEDDINQLLGPFFLLDLLPVDFRSGADGMGSLSIQQIRAVSFFRKPWLYQEDQIRNLVRMTKKQFFNLVLT